MAESESLFDEFLKNSDSFRLFHQEKAIYRITEALEEVLDTQQVSRTELAQRLGRTKSWVTQLLDGEQNKTIRTVADVAAVLGCELQVSLMPIGNQSSRHSSESISTLQFSRQPKAMEYRYSKTAGGKRFVPIDMQRSAS